LTEFLSRVIASDFRSNPEKDPKNKKQIIFLMLWLFGFFLGCFVVKELLLKTSNDFVGGSLANTPRQPVIPRTIYSRPRDDDRGGGWSFLIFPTIF